MQKFIVHFLSDPQLYQYALVGGASAVVDLSLFLIIRQAFTIHYLGIATFTFLFATLVNYVLCKRFLFTHSQQPMFAKQLVLTYFVSFIGLGIHHSCLYALFEKMLLPLFISKIGAMGVAFIWNFSSRKYWVFKSSAPLRCPPVARQQKNSQSYTRAKRTNPLTAHPLKG